MKYLALALSLLLFGCASTAQPDKASDKVTGIATTPLADLNLVNAPIPEPLLAAQKAPYALPAGATCQSLNAEIQMLDSYLGPDLDAPPNENHPNLIERSGDLAASTLKKTVEGAIPYRGWIRKISGAERYSKQVVAATTAGGIRRGFLKGARSAMACPA